jgi:hypothetical protein
MVLDLDMFTDPVYWSGRNVAAQSSDADALSSALLQDVQDAANSVVPPDDGSTGLHAIGRKVGDAVVAFGADRMQPALAGLLTDIVDLGDVTSDSAVIVDEADIAAYQANLGAVQAFAWQDPANPTTVPVPPTPPTTTPTTTPSGAN